MTPQEILEIAAGRSLVAGEHHTDRYCLRRSIRLMGDADNFGYRTLGVELSEESVKVGDVIHEGLKEVVEHLRLIGDQPIPTHDESGALTYNHYWYVRYALRIGWAVVAIDPLYRDAFVGDRYARREPATARIILDQGPMIAFPGLGHLPGLHGILGPSVEYISMFTVPKDDVHQREYLKEVGAARLGSIATIPLLSV